MFREEALGILVAKQSARAGGSSAIRGMRTLGTEMNKGCGSGGEGALHTSEEVRGSVLLNISLASGCLFPVGTVHGCWLYSTEERKAVNK